MNFPGLHKVVLLLIILPFIDFHSQAKITLPSIIDDHMVLQQNSEVAIWGWGSPGETVTIKVSWSEQTWETKANSYADWMIKINTPSAGGPYEITITGYNEIKLADVLIGEVWLASGQSNMQWSVNSNIDNKEQALATADQPLIRLFHVTRKSAENPQLDVDGEWKICNAENVGEFSAVAYFFGKELQTNLNVPIGLIHSSWGGTPAETWINNKWVEKDTRLKAASMTNNPVPWCPEKPGATYNAMIAPITSFDIAGVIWYQGESNTGNPHEYTYVFSELIKNWRAEWEKEMPFYFVQIAPYKYGIPMQASVLQESQLQTMRRVNNTGMAVINDIGNPEDIHPTNKLDVGLRLSKLALAKTYGKDIPYSGPLFREMQIRGRKAILLFDHVEDGLVLKNENGDGKFEIAGEDRKFFAASVKLNGNSLIVQSDKVKDPVAIRYCWGNMAEGVLFNSVGLPASAFRTDQWPIPIENSEN